MPQVFQKNAFWKANKILRMEVHKENDKKEARWKLFDVWEMQTGKTGWV